MQYRLSLTLFGISGLLLVLAGCSGGGNASDIDLGNSYILIATKTDNAQAKVCQENAEDLLNRRPKVGCLVGLWEYNPPALLRAVKNSERKPAIVAFDENAQTLQGIREGSIIGTIVQNPYEFGYQSVKVLAAYVKGKEDPLKNWPGIEKNQSIFVPHRTITKDNVDAYEAEVQKILAAKISDNSSEQAGKPKVAFVTNNPEQFWTFAEKGAEKAAAEFGMQLTFKRPQDGSAKVQQEIISDLLTKGYQGIAVSPVSKNTLSFFKDEVAPKVALLMTDNDLPDPSARKCYIGTHNYRAGRAAGELVKKALPQGGEIAIFVGQMDASNAVERRQGVLDVLAGKNLQEMGEITPNK